MLTEFCGVGIMPILNKKVMTEGLNMDGCLIPGSSLLTIVQTEWLAERERQEDLKATEL